MQQTLEKPETYSMQQWADYLSDAIILANDQGQILQINKTAEVLCE